MPVSPDTKAIVAALDQLERGLRKFTAEAAKIARSLEQMNEQLKKKDDGDDSPPT